MATSGLAPLRGAIHFIIRSGGLRGLRPPATVFATLRVAELSPLLGEHLAHSLSGTDSCDRRRNVRPKLNPVFAAKARNVLIGQRDQDVLMEFE